MAQKQLPIFRPQKHPIVELGLDTFGDAGRDSEGNRIPYPEVIRNILAQGVRADQLGIDFFGVGEHHRPDFASSAPDVLLAGLATRTEQITLSSSVTVLSSDDPVRVFQRFATVDALSGGRAEVTLGRGSFTESFPLFGYELSQYEQLFSEKLDLFHHLQPEGTVDWNGELRASVRGLEVFPKTAAGLPAWIAVGGSPESVVRAARYQMPLMLAIIGGPADRFVPYADLYRQANEQLGNPQLPIGVHSPGHVAETDAQARAELYDAWLASRIQMGRERGWGDPSPGDFEREIEGGALHVGSPETVAQKIAQSVSALGLNRFNLKYAVGDLPHDVMMRSIELYGTEVLPRVRELLAEDGYRPANMSG